MSVSFEVTVAESAVVDKIVKRVMVFYRRNGVSRDRLDIRMDLVATHANGCPIDFDRLEAADEFNLMHDIAGIALHLDRRTGRLTGHFRPKCCKREAEGIVS